MTRHLTSICFITLFAACSGGGNGTTEPAATAQFEGRFTLSPDRMTLVDCAGGAVVLDPNNLPEDLTAVIDKTQAEPARELWVVIKGVAQGDGNGPATVQVAELVSISETAPCVSMMPGTYLPKEEDPELVGKLGVMEGGSYQLVIVERATGTREDYAGTWRVNGTNLEMTWKDGDIKASLTEDEGVRITLPGRDKQMVFYHQ